MPHPELIFRQDAIALAGYRLARMRFLLDYPAAEKPPDIDDLGTGWVSDCIAVIRKDALAEKETDG